MAAEPATRGWPHVQIPDEDQFKGDQFMPAPELEAQITELLEREEFGLIAGFTYAALWNNQGGNSGGAHRLGATVFPSGHYRHLAQADVVIWLAADHLRERQPTDRQLEALLYHQLCEVGVNNQGAVSRRQYEFRGWIQEITTYGADAITPKLRAAVLQTTQLRLLPDQPEPTDDTDEDGATDDGAE